MSDLKRFDALTFHGAQPGWLDRFRREIPGEFWTLDVDEDGERVAVIACPCGAAARAPAASLGGDGYDGCDCGRVYLFTGRAVRVAYLTADGEPIGAEPVASD